MELDLRLERKPLKPHHASVVSPLHWLFQHSGCEDRPGRHLGRKVWLEERRRQERPLPCDLWFPRKNQPAFLWEASGPGRGPYTAKGKSPLQALPTTSPYLRVVGCSLHAPSQGRASVQREARKMRTPSESPVDGQGRLGTRGRCCWVEEPVGQWTVHRPGLRSGLPGFAMWHQASPTLSLGSWLVF